MEENPCLLSMTLIDICHIYHLMDWWILVLFAFLEVKHPELQRNKKENCFRFFSSLAVLAAAHGKKIKKS